MALIISKAETVTLLALGDSYTIGESVAIQERWPMLLVEKLRSEKINCDNPTIIATTGWRTDDLKHALEKASLDQSYNLVSLLIGVNNQYQHKPLSVYAVEFEQLLHTAIDHARGDKNNVFVLSIPDYGFTPFGKEKQQTISTAIDEFNAINKSITDKVGVTYVDITDISRKGFNDPELVAADGLHPSRKMYKQWVTRILNTLSYKPSN